MLEKRILVVIFGMALLAGGVGIAAARYDAAIMERLYMQPPLLASVMKVVTFYGSWFVLIPAVVIGMLLSYKHLRGDLAMRMGVSGVGAAALVEILKLILARTRPTVLHQVSSSGASFPSGHALDSMVIYGMLALILMSLLPASARWTRLLLVIPLLIGWSRVYLGVHWPSDVLGGWGIGLMILAVAAPAMPVTPPATEPTVSPSAQ